MYSSLNSKLSFLAGYRRSNKANRSREFGVLIVLRSMLFHLAFASGQSYLQLVGERKQASVFLFQGLLTRLGILSGKNAFKALGNLSSLSAHQKKLEGLKRQYEFILRDYQQVTFDYLTVIDRSPEYVQKELHSKSSPITTSLNTSLDKSVIIPSIYEKPEKQLERSIYVRAWKKAVEMGHLVTDSDHIKFQLPIPYEFGDAAQEVRPDNSESNSLSKASFWLLLKYLVYAGIGLAGEYLVMKQYLFSVMNMGNKAWVSAFAILSLSGFLSFALSKIVARELRFKMLEKTKSQKWFKWTVTAAILVIACAIGGNYYHYIEVNSALEMLLSGVAETEEQIQLLEHKIMTVPMWAEVCRIVSVVLLTSIVLLTTSALSVILEQYTYVYRLKRKKAKLQKRLTRIPEDYTKVYYDIILAVQARRQHLYYLGLLTACEAMIADGQDL